MGNAASDSAYLFLGINAAGDSPAMDIVVCADTGEAIARARHWLASHLSCVRAQVWQDDVLVADVLRERA